MNKMKSAKSLKKPAPIVPISSAIRDTDNDIKFELELCWCVQQLENSLISGKLSQKVAEETSKNIKVLKSCSAPLIKKRQMMKTLFGDYRSKMREEEKKLALASKQIKFIPSADLNKKSSFVKKSAILTSGKDFRFNFTPATTIKTAQIDLDDIEKSDTTGSSLSANYDLNLAGGQFMFNFIIDGVDDGLDLNDLSIKN